MKKALAFVLAFLLAGTMILFCVSFLGRQAILPSMKEEGTPMSDGMIRQERELARKRVTKLADLYGFQADPVMEIIDEDTLRNLSLQASQWWGSILQNGKPGTNITWDTDKLEETLYSDETLIKRAAESDEDLATASFDAVNNSILRMILPVRDQLIWIGLTEVAKRVDIANLVAFFLGIPWAALALCALLAGLIVLLAGRGNRDALIYIGSSLGAAALVLAVLMILLLCAGIQPMIREASESLAILYQDVVTHTLIIAGILIAAMTAGCVLCLANSRAKQKTA